MSQRNFSVIVTPDAWEASLDELSRILAPMTTVRAKQLVPVLERGAMTLDADLSQEEARRLLDRLEAAAVPAHIVDGDGNVVAESGTSHDESPELAEVSDAEDVSLELDALDDEGEPDQGWGSFLGDADIEELDLPGSDEAEPPEHPHESAPSIELDSSFGAEPSESTRSTQPAVDSSAPRSSEPPPQIPSRGLEDDAPEPDSAETPAAPEITEPVGSMSESGFDASRLNAALQPDSDRPPYEPDGFDDRNEHIPALAAFLSLVAPGAGQTYNGEPEKSWQFGTRFALLVPWYRSIRQAWERAEQIRTYYAPRPDKGAVGRALKYAVSWWIIVGGIVAVLGFAGYAGHKAWNRPDRPKITDADVRSAHDEARRQVGLARIAGLDGVSAYLDERDRNGQRFTMSKDERAERLFRKAYQKCKSGEYDTCESAMKRVSTLSPTFRRDAYKLQAWASMQGSPDSPDQPMPKVDIGTLENYESDRDAVDPPPEESTIGAGEDAGADPQEDGSTPGSQGTQPTIESKDAP